MSEPKETNPGVALENRTSEQQESKPGMEGLSRRTFLGIGSAGLASAALASLAVNAQDRTDIEKGEHDQSFSRLPSTRFTGPAERCSDHCESGECYFGVSNDHKLAWLCGGLQLDPGCDFQGNSGIRELQRATC